MAKVFFHTRTPGKRDWVNEDRNFVQIPAVGEYVCTEDQDDGKWHRVELVVHTPFDCPYDAEV